MSNGGLPAPDQELIAAFIDGRMSEEDRRSFMQRLDEEEVLYEVFVETVRFRDQESGRPATVVEHPAMRRQGGRLAALAAVLAIAVATPALLRNLGDEEFAETLAVNDGLAGTLGEGWYEQGWSRNRGIAPGRAESDAAFRVGVQAMDLEIALRLDRADEAVILTHRLEGELSAVELSQPLRLCYEGIRELIEGGAPDGALAMARSAECVFGEQFPDLAAANRLGGWTEAGRLAARSGNRELLGSRSFGDELRSLRREEEWDPVVVMEVESIATLLEVPAADLDLPALEAAFTAIINEG